MKLLEILGKRDYEIVEFILKGYTVPQIAEEMGYTPSTIKTYKKQIFRTLDVHDKKELFERVNKLKNE